MSRPRKVLIGFSAALAAPEVAWSLLDAGFRVSVFARKGKRSPLSCCRRVDIIEITPPEQDAYSAISCLERLVYNQKFAVIMPLDDVSVWLCDGVSRKVNIPVVGPTGKHKDIALDKRLQLKVASECGFSIPETVYLDSFKQAFALKRYPFILKSALAVQSFAGRLEQVSNRICANRKELKSCVRHWNKEMPLIAQPLLNGIGEGLFGIATKNGIENWSAHRRIRMMNPTGSGSSACRSIPVDNSLKESAARMMTKVGWRGLFMIEVLRDEAGQAWFMELNGRSWGSMALARKRGFEYPAWALQQVLDRDFQLPHVQPNDPVICRHLGREIIHLLIVMHGPKSKAAVRWPSRWKTFWEVLRFRRGDCWYNWQPGETALFLNDTLQTVLNKIVRRKKG